ncbi:UNVERIFIED_CONTAM: hypothetical protein GTU68_034399 [Idotea baltica]|nr:hypothetical protein [Idotea baltica]
MIHVIGTVLNQEVFKLWHKEEDLHGLNPSDDCIIVPGGFSYGDYLRAGAIARFSPIMRGVVSFAEQGGLVFGICNGFQILCESRLLPGALLRNRDQKFISKSIDLLVQNNQTRLTAGIREGQILRMPIAHAEGRYYADEKTIADLETNGQILFSESNINGSVNNIAGICNRRGNVFGMMPHPERASERILGSEDGYALFASLIGKQTVAK